MQVHKSKENDQTAPTFRAPINSVRTIVLASAKYFQMNPTEIYSHRRDTYAVRARHVACYLAKEMTTLSYPVIGRFIGDRDHTTILHAVRRITLLLIKDPKLQRDINAVRALAIARDCRLDPNFTTSDETPIWS
jgi:chromosomal replication initiation ATPase DnaA